MKKPSLPTTGGGSGSTLVSIPDASRRQADPTTQSDSAACPPDRDGNYVYTSELEVLTPRRQRRGTRTVFAEAENRWHTELFAWINEYSEIDPPMQWADGHLRWRARYLPRVCGQEIQGLFFGSAKSHYVE